MTKDEKRLLIQDLCERLPYNVIVRCYFVDGGGEEVLDTDDIADMLYNDEDSEFPIYKPYLRPLSSMTEEEGKELEHIFSEIDAPCWVDTEYGCVNFAGGNDFIDSKMADVYTNWLNANHFDYRGLIPMGLALEAPEDLYSNKSECDENGWEKKVNRLVHIELTEEERKKLEDSMYDENGWKDLGNGLKMDRSGCIAGGLKLK